LYNIENIWRQIQIDAKIMKDQIREAQKVRDLQLYLLLVKDLFRPLNAGYGFGTLRSE
jgi:hypothetical protein